MFLLRNGYCPSTVSAAFSQRSKDAHKMKLNTAFVHKTLQCFFQLCSQDSFHHAWTWGLDQKETSTFLTAPFSFIWMTELQQPVCSGWPRRAAALSPSLYKSGEYARKWKRKQGSKISRAAALALLTVGCAWQPSSRLSYGQQELEDGDWAKMKRTGFIPFCIAHLRPNILNFWKLLIWNTPTTNKAEQSKRYRICHAPFWPASLLQGFTGIWRLWQNCCNWRALENMMI